MESFIGFMEFFTDDHKTDLNDYDCCGNDDNNEDYGCCGNDDNNEDYDCCGNDDDEDYSHEICNESDYFEDLLDVADDDYDDDMPF